MIDSHVSAHYDELETCVHNGITVKIDGEVVQFNVIVFFIADLCFIKDVIGMFYIQRIPNFV